jgi:hypothetical protein
MLSEWQIAILDVGLVAVPLLAIIAILVFPWDHWNSLLEEKDESKR